MTRIWRRQSDDSERARTKPQRTPFVEGAHITALSRYYAGMAATPYVPLCEWEHARPTVPHIHASVFAAVPMVAGDMVGIDGAGNVHVLRELPGTAEVWARGHAQ